MRTFALSPMASAIALTLITVTSLNDARAQSAAQSSNPASSANVAAPSTESKTSKREEIRVDGKSLVPFAVDISTGATKSSAPLIETPQSVSVVTRELMDAQGVDSLSDVLRYVSGVTPQTAGRRGFDDFVIRGFSQSAYAFRDGLRADPGFLTEQESYGFERVEVVKGPGSVLYGQVAPGGLVNMVSKRPQFGLSKSLTSLELGIGQFGNTRMAIDSRGAFDESVLKGDLAWRAVALVRDRHDVVPNAGAGRVYVAPALAWRIGANTTLTALASMQRDEVTRVVALPARGTVLLNPNGRIALDLFLGEPGFDRLTIPQWSVGYTFEHRFNDNISFTQNTRRNGYEVGGQNLNVGAISANGLTVGRNPIFLDIDNDQTAVDNQFNIKWGSGALRNETLVGFDYLRFRNRQTQRLGTIAPLNLFAPVYGAVVTPAANFSNNRRQLQTQEGVYLQNIARIADTIVVHTGVRRDEARDETQNYLNNTRVNVKQNATTGRIGIVWLAPMGFAPYASYSGSFVPLIANPLRDGSSVKPEEGEQTEFGVKWGPRDGSVQATVARFDLKRKNVVSADPTNTAFSVQVGEQRHKGTEFEINARIARMVDVVLQYSTLDAIVTSSTTGNQGKRPQNAPKRSAGIWTTWRLDMLGARGWDVSVGARNVSSRVGDVLNTYDVPGYTVADVAARYRNGPLTLAVNIRNVGDKDYFLGTTAGTNVSVGEKRTAILSMRYDW
jgi:iron complex outermembrane recepter protein